MLKNERHVRAGLAAAGQSEREDEGAVMSSSLSIGDDGRSMRLGEVSTGSGGGSRLAKTSIGSAAVQAALTLHPCVHVQGCGDASESAMHALLSSVGPCRIRMYRDEETGESEGELSCTYGNAAAATAAIEDHRALQRLTLRRRLPDCYGGQDGGALDTSTTLVNSTTAPRDGRF